MIILGDLSGIQDYLFEVAEVGGKQAKSLRFRSLYIQLLADAINWRIRHAGGLSDDRVLFSVAAKFAIDATGLTQPQLQDVRREIYNIDSWLRNNTRARLRLNVIVSDDPGTLAQQYIAANERLLFAKCRGWSAAAAESGWRSDHLIAPPRSNSADVDRDVELGRQVVRPGSGFLIMDRTGTGQWEVAGLKLRIESSQPSDTADLLVRDLQKVMRHVPTENGQIIEFVDLATQHARGSPRLGVLKADADSLGAAFANTLLTTGGLQALRDLSARLDQFFAVRLNELVAKDSRWSNLYTIFSGGDDVLLVGPWDIAIDFAGFLNERFHEQFTNEGLTLSAAVAIIKPRFPIRLAVEEVERLLERAKTQHAPRASNSKDQCAVLGGLWKWNHHQDIISAAKQLADWIKSPENPGGVIERGWLHTLLDLCLLRRGQQSSPANNAHPAMATARLAYHVARNWPPSSHPARQWIDRILRAFDQYESTTDIQAIHLPAIIRYAMLATHRTGADT